MSVFGERRLTNDDMHLDVTGLRRGVYSDKYFENVMRVLLGLSAEQTIFNGQPIGDIVVEVQVFNRRAPRALVGGVDAALVMLRHATGYTDGAKFEETWDRLEVEAVRDGTFTEYAGDPMDVQPVIKIRGRYRDFALLETPILGVLSRVTRMATNVYDVLTVSNGKPVLFFPARFDLHEAQAADGYAYRLAVQRYNLDFGYQTQPIISTDAQGAWWGGHGGGTIPHALIACFQGDSAAAMVAFAEHIDVTVPRILLADFNNDTVADALATLNAYWPRYREAVQSGDEVRQRRWTLNGVRLDTSGNMLDQSLIDPADKGVSAALVRTVRAEIDRAWESWGEVGELAEVARDYCRNVQIVVTGGFNREKIERFEREGVPVDSYGVGSTFLTNDKTTNADYTMDVVRVQVDGRWTDAAKVGRQACDNPDLERVDLSNL